MKTILKRSAFHYIRKHPLQIALSLLGIALGVAVVVAIDLANSSSSRAFEISMESIAGKATHHITGSADVMPESLYTFLKINKKADPVAPVIESDVKTVRHPQRIFTLIGIDPFAEKPFRSYLSDIDSRINTGVAAFLTNNSAVMISSVTAREMGLKENDTLTIWFAGKYKKIKILGLVSPQDEHSRQVLSNLMICDISTAQEILNLPGKLSRIDLIIPENNQGQKKLSSIARSLPDGLSINRSETRTQIAADMVKAFDINLTALSLLALIVGMFLTYNTMTFSVVRRRKYIGLLRSIGVTRNEIFRIFLFEALILAVAGTILGLLAGVLLAKAILQIVTRTINDLYFSVSVRELNISLLSILKGLFIGIGATLIAALKPSYEASSVPAGIALSRSEQEIKLRRKIPRLSFMGLVSLITGVVILLLPGKSIILSYAGIMPVIMGFSLLTPLMIVILMKVIKYLASKIFGITGKIASMSIVTQISRTAIAVAALSIAVSATVGIGTMINSFRQTVVKWLEGNLKADVFISSPGLVLRQTDSPLDSALVARILRLPEVKDFNFYKDVTRNSGNGQPAVIALKIGERSYKDFKLKQGDPKKVWPEFQNSNSAIVTEPYAYKHNTNIGDMISIATDKGLKNFRVTGIYYDYSSDLGYVVISYNMYKRYWNDNSVSGLSLFLKDRVNKDSLITAIQTMAPSGQQILVRSNTKLMNASIEVFDRTFLITNVLQILAIIVAFIGVLSALMALQFERSREFAILRANGLTPRQLWKLLILQTGLMGVISGILALPLGNILAWILIYVINKRSFGWTLQYMVMPEILIEALLVALFAALIAGVYPAYKMSKTSPALALRDE
ncbi:MAG: FtsX-like permease family protein [Bacillota bacterium]